MVDSRTLSGVATIWLTCCALSCVCAPNHLSSCFTPSQQPGRCILNSKCEEYKKSYEKFGSTNGEYFKMLQCGIEGGESKVCCPETGTYNITREVQSQEAIVVRSGAASVVPDLKKCGVQNIENKIFNGNITNIDEFPWMALLFYRIKLRSEDYRFACGGVLINDRYVLTAAHCVYGNNVDKLGGLDSVRLGEYNVDTAEDCIEEIGFKDCSDKPVDIRPESITIHPGYHPNATQQHNDIALIRLSQKVDFSYYVQPICLPDTDVFLEHKLSPGDRLYVAGWGVTESGPKSPVKLKLDVPVISMDECRQVYRRRYKFNLDESQVCAGGEQGRDSCKGDSGGPLMVQDPMYGNWIAAGIVSTGLNTCGQSGVPGIYTNIKHFMPWISKTIEE